MHSNLGGQLILVQLILGQWLLVQIGTAIALTCAGEEQIKVRNPAYHVGTLCAHKHTGTEVPGGV